MNATVFFIFFEVKESLLDFSHGTARVLWNYFNIISIYCKITHYNSVNVSLFNSQLDELKSGIQNETCVNLRLSLSMIGESND